MLTCRHPRTGTAREAGFTLIEILVVVVIIAIISSFVLLSGNVVGDNRELEREARRLASLIELAADEAELQGRDLGIEFIRQGYRFVEYDPFFDSWTEVVGDDLLRPRDIPDSFALRLVVEGKRVELAETVAETGNPDDEQTLSSPLVQKYAPHAMILSSGDVSPFELTISRLAGGEELAFRVEPSGRIVIGDEVPDDG